MKFAAFIKTLRNRLVDKQYAIVAKEYESHIHMNSPYGNQSVTITYHHYHSMNNIEVQVGSVHVEGMIIDEASNNKELKKDWLYLQDLVKNIVETHIQEMIDGI